MFNVHTRFEFLDVAVPANGYQHFVIGMDDADGPMLTLTTHLPSGFYFDSRWWWRPPGKKSSLRLVFSVQSLTSGMECYTWRPAIKHPAFDYFVLPDLIGGEAVWTPENPVAYCGTLTVKELEVPDFETFLWFDGGTTPKFCLGWQRPHDRDPQWPSSEGKQIAP